MFPHSGMAQYLDYGRPARSDQRRNSLLHRSILSELAGKPKKIFADILRVAPYFKLQAAVRPPGTSIAFESNYPARLDCA